MQTATVLCPPRSFSLPTRTDGLGVQNCPQGPRCSWCPQHTSAAAAGGQRYLRSSQLALSGPSAAPGAEGTSVNGFILPIHPHRWCWWVTHQSSRGLPSCCAAVCLSCSSALDGRRKGSPNSQHRWQVFNQMLPPVQDFSTSALGFPPADGRAGLRHEQQGGRAFHPGQAAAERR